MRKVITGGIAAVLGVSTVVASGAFAGQGDGPAGAAVRWIQPQTTSDNNQCDPAASNANTGHGLAITNAPGKPDAAIKVNGEVTLKNATPASAYTVWLATDSSNCKLESAIVTNGQGNGNAHLDDPLLNNGTYYVVIKDDQQNEQFATTPATIR